MGKKLEEKSSKYVKHTVYSNGFVPGTHRQGLQGEQIQMPVCKSHHAFSAHNMHIILSASRHRLSHIHHSVVSLSIWG